ncbi:MAG: 3'-5' exonuclease, partial [Clostridia bacterium]|nr:3'-5' exonuclease [Clostridia bacterium]
MAFDTETTGLSAEKERVIEIGAVKFNKNGIIEKFGTLINPEKYISPQITQITNITNQMLDGQPTAKEV